MLSAFSVEHCPPSWWNTVRHQRGIVSAIAWNTHPCDLGWGSDRCRPPALGIERFPVHAAPLPAGRFRTGLGPPGR
ncbi:hypothetical protein F7Q92_21470, partial [Ideonella dechloratans]